MPFKKLIINLLGLLKYNQFKYTPKLFSKTFFFRFFLKKKDKQEIKKIDCLIFLFLHLNVERWVFCQKKC